MFLLLIFLEKDLLNLEAGDSAMDEVHNLTYQIIEEKGKFESDFLVTLENWDHINNLRVANNY